MRFLQVNNGRRLSGQSPGLVDGACGENGPDSHWLAVVGPSRGSGGRPRPELDPVHGNGEREREIQWTSGIDGLSRLGAAIKIDSALAPQGSSSTVIIHDNERIIKLVSEPYALWFAPGHYNTT